MGVLEPSLHRESTESLIMWLYVPSTHSCMLTKLSCVGAGIYVVSSRDYVNKAVPNNDLIVQRSCSNNFCKVDFYCYSNSSSTSVGYIYYPNNVRRYSGHYYDITVSRQSPAGIRATNEYTRTPDVWGIYTCQIPDSRGSMLEKNIGIYSSMPSMYYKLSSSYLPVY